MQPRVIQQEAVQRLFHFRLKLQVQNRPIGHFKDKVQKIGPQIHAVQFRRQRPSHLGLSRDAKRTQRMITQRQCKMFEHQVLAISRYHHDSPRPLPLYATHILAYRGTFAFRVGAFAARMSYVSRRYPIGRSGRAKTANSGLPPFREPL